MSRSTEIKGYSLHHTDTDTYTYNHHHHNNKRYPHPYPHNQHHQHHTPYQHNSPSSSSSYPRSRTTSSDQYNPSFYPSSSTQLPKFTFQKPSPVEPPLHVLPPLPYPNSKPSYVGLSNRQSVPRSSHHYHPHHTSASSSTSFFGLNPPPNKYSSRGSSSSSTRSYTTRIVSPTSRTSDLAKYAMMKDEKPIINNDDGETPREERTSSSSNSLTIDVELSRKRKEREGDDPSTPHSASSVSSSYLLTPQFGSTEEPLSRKRRLSILEHLALKEEVDKDFKLDPSSLAIKKGEEPFPWMRNSYDISNYPVPHQEPITVFPVQYQIYQQPNQANNNTPQQGGQQQPQGNEAPNTLAAQQNNNNNSIQLDPILSSMRSSAAPTSNGNNQNVLDPALTAPEIRFPDETLASATASPSRDGGNNSSAPGDVNTQAALMAVNTPTLTAEDAAALLAPPTTQEGEQSSKKEQPFSRSPELRVSHKLAERKRRKEMKELFDELRDELPSDRGMKASKWEILSKAIDHCRQLKQNQEQMVREIDHLRREVDIARGGTGAYTHAYPTYNLAGTYPPQTNYAANNTAGAATTTAQQPVQNVQNVQAQPQQPQQQPQQQQAQAQQQVPQQPQQQQQPVQAQQNQTQSQPMDTIDQITQIKVDGTQTPTQ